MPSKLDFYSQMADRTARQVTGSFGEWTAFLETMGRLYKYPFHEQLMIFAQKPNATACADYDLWNKQMGRYVRRGTKGIALIDTSGDNPRLKYVFDVSDTGGRENSRRLNLWEYKDEHQDTVTAALENRFGVSGEKGLADQLEQIASKLVTEYWNDNSRDILGILADSFLEEYDDYNVEVAFRNAATVSTTYALMSRCGLNPGDYFEHEDFLSVFDFNTRDTIAVLGSAVSNSSEQILRQVAIAVKNHEREASLQNQAERKQNYGEHIELHEERGLLYPESDPVRDRDEALGQVRQDEEEVSAGAQTSAVEPDDSVGDPVPPSEGNRRDSEPQNGTDDARTDEAERRDGGTESQRPDDVDGTNEQPQSTSRRSNSRRTDSGITGQLTLFDEGLFPTEQEQIAFIDEAESVRPTPFAFSFAQEDIDDVLRLASNSEHTQMNVAAAFQKQKPMEEIVSLLKKEYHGGAGLKSERGEFSVWYAEDGIHLAKGRTARYSKSAQVVSWEAAAERIGQLMDEGKYATNVELAEAEFHERTELSQKLWYIRGDLSDEAREQNILGTLQDYRRGGFPDATARLAEDLKDPAFRQTVSADFTAFMDAYKADRDVMRFHFHKPVEIWNALQDLDLPRREYTSDMAEVPKVGMFITDDEIDATLTRGSNVEGGKGRIYTYLTGSHNSKEKTDFLKNEYGISGSSHSVSGRGWIDSSGKGIRLRKPECADVELNWNKVLARFENIIRNGRYFTPEEQAKYDEMQTREGQFRKLMGAYNDIKHDHRDDIVLFQVGDFFEMYGEDAKTAAELLDLNLTTRPVAGAGRVEMCGIPAHNLEQSVDKLRATHGVTISDFNGIVNEHISRSWPVFSFVEELPREAENEPVSVTEAQNEPPTATVEATVVSREITQTEIDEALQRWNGDIESKRAVVRYMADHARERDTAAWLSKEYGGDVSKPLHITVAGTDIDYEMSWAKVQRRVAQLIKEERFYTEAEYDSLDNIDPIALREALAQRGIVNGELVDPEKLDNDPFIKMVEADVERIAQREADEVFAKEHLIPRESTFEIDGRRFVVDSVNLDFGTVSLQDVTFQNATGFPIFRSESIEFMRRLVEISEAQRSAELPAEPTTAEPKPELHNFQITDDHLGEGGAKAKFRMNMDAINLLKELEFDGRQATPEEQEVLAKYVGWGGLADAFDETKDNWKNEFAELYATLSPEEYAAARSSTLNAHYTSPTVIKAIYEAVGNIGFETGNILEPSMGVGNFFGCLPEAMQNSKLYGVELDSITGRIAKQLYPKADITIAGFETTDRRDFYDLAIGNVPFGQYQVNDRAYNKLGFSIHDYFFAKALDQVRPGGVVAFVTSRYTMDKQSPEVRKYIAQRADLLGAIRLPNNAFKANAGTEVVSDIIFLQKRDRPIEIEPDWVHLGKNDDGFAINSYFIDNPEMVLGRQTSESTQYGKQDFTVEPYENLDLGVQLKYAIQNIKGTYTEAELPELGEGEAIDTSIPADPNVKNYSYTVVDGDVYYRENSRMVKPDLNATATERVKGMVELRDCVQKLIGQQMDGFVSDAAIRETQRELNDLYDKFTAKHGLINSRGNALAFADDSSYYLLCSLEVLDEDNNLKRKADMFTKRTIKPSEVVTSVDTASEALAVSIAEKARVDMEYMSSLTGKSEEELASDLRGVIYMDFNRKPDGSYTWRTADDFLSGDVREKLAYYQKALEYTEGTEKHHFILDNVEALKMAQPKDLDASEIEVRLGATWIDKSYIQQFMVETFEPPYYLRRSIEVNYSPFSAEWNITGKSQPSYSDVNAYMTYGTERANAYKILEDTLNLRDVRIYDTVTDPDGKERRVLNSKETTLAQQKQQAIKDAFQDWIWRDPDRRQELVTKYNELFNSNRPREYDGSHIVFSGMNPEIKLREHQLNAVAHILYGGNTLLAHEVGAGKTFEMVAAAMESKRLGLCQKPLFVVPNHLTEQWASEFLRLYPSANILAATKKDFEPRNRKKFCGRIATGDYDAIIIGHSQFERIPVSQERQERLLQEQIAEIEEGLEELKASRAERFTIKSLERTKKGLETRLQKLQDSSRKDDVITFEQLGVDRLYVDEAHNYKNLFLYTKMRNVAGLSTTDAQKSSDMLLKCRYIDEITDSRGVVFATGTPVSNSMTELYTMMRYLQHDTIRGKGLAHFDCWASTFGETTTAIELAPEGTGYRARTRFAKFFNLPELMNLFKEAADIKTADQLNLPTPTPIYHNEVAQPTEIQKAMVQELSERAAAVHSGKVDPSVDNMLRITSDGRKLGLDQRIINPNLPDEPTSKVNMCVDNIHRIWEDGHADKLTQLVFCDLSTPKSTPSKRAAKAPAGNLDSPELRALEHLAEKDGGTEEEQRFTVYDDIRDKLVERGIPREQIAFIHEANTEARKKELFSKVRSGQVRVLMGSTFKMGAGMNVQDRLIALHDLDAPWRPGDLEQRSGRIIRQGNRNAEVHIYRYVTEATFDAYLWQTLENKQKFISQIMTSKSPVRACDDIDETALSYAEIKALCAGDERIKEKMDLDVDVARLKLMKANHQSQQYRLEDNLLRYFPEQIEQNKKFIEGFNADMKTLAEHPHPVDGFAGMTVRGDVLTDKENAGAALVDAFKDVKGLDPVQIGTYRGFTMSLTLEDFGRDYVLTLKGQMTHRVTLGKDPRGNLTRIDNALNGMAERLTTVQGKLDSLYSQMETAKQELGKPFPQEAELKTKSARLAELNIALNIDDKTPLEAMAEEAPPRAEIAKSAKPSVLQKLHSYDKSSKAVPTGSKYQHRENTVR